MFVDETWAPTNMAPCYGRGPRGQRVEGLAPFGHWKTTTFLAGLRHDRIVAPCVFDGPINGQRFLAWVDQALAPTLKPGDIVVMDNLSAHKVAGVRQAVEAKGAKIAYLPPYSPDLNPIGQLFAKIKAILRTLAARSKDALWDALRVALEQCDDDQFEAYLRNCGYGST